MGDFDTTATELDEDDQFAPDFDGGGSADDMTVDFTGVEAMGGFVAIPAGWYLCAVTDYSDTETKNPGKLPQGTPGTNWEFTVQNGDHENRKLWTNHWHHPKTFGFMKGFLVSLDNFTDEELEGQFRLRDRQRAVGQLVLVKVAVRKYNGDDVNDIKAFKNHNEADNVAGDELAPT
jgi:hypothetical protein